MGFLQNVSWLSHVTGDLCAAASESFDWLDADRDDVLAFRRGDLRLIGGHECGPARTIGLVKGIEPGQAPAEAGAGPGLVTPRTERIPFAKGHGTRNDFVVLPDPERSIDLTDDLVVALCDRRSGIGADGVLRVVRSAVEPDAVAMAGEAEWFMDYRNADASIAETCGNGLRVFARYLVDSGLASPGLLPIATRAGVVQVDVDVEGDVTVDMGVPAVFDSAIVTVGDVKFEGLHISMGNPHLVCVTDTPVASLDLTKLPNVDPLVFPTGVNVELVNLVDDTHAVMRVHERGVGETESCGSGACAVAAALAVRQSVTSGEWELEVPGGTLHLRLDSSTGHVFLSGPAVIVAQGYWLQN